MQPKFNKGQVVRLANTNKKGVICEEPKIISGQYHYELFIENTHKTYSEESLELDERKKIDIYDLANDKFSSLKDFKSYLTFIKVERPLSNNLYAFLSSRTEFEVHQFKPVLKFLQSPYQRLLIADEVGVGKTIEAGIIYTELLSRHKLNNVLIICPSALRYKWQKEMKRRFGEEFGLIDSKKMKAFFKRYDRSPFGVGIKGIASIQMLRSEEILAELERLQIAFDFVIIDEAHHMRNSETRSHTLGKILTSSTEGMIFLSATPLQLGNMDLFNLFNILLPEEFDNFDTFKEQVKPNEYINLALRKISNKEEISSILSALKNIETTTQSSRFLSNPNYMQCINVLETSRELGNKEIIFLQRKLNELNVLTQIYTRTKKKEINIKNPIREPVTIKVDFSEQEKLFYNKVSDLFLKLNPDCPPGFLLQMPQRQVASCIPAAKEYLKDIYKSGMIDLAKEDNIDDEEDEEQKIIITKADLEEIKQIIQFTETIPEPDSKTSSFISTISEIIKKGEIKKIIIFSFFKRTLKYLEKQLKKLNVSIARIDGDVPPVEREIIIDNFSKPEGYQILLSSEVGGEGLDMQFCNCMFNYDLPWNPMRVEQRIGRLDRYGQQNDKIHIYNFSVEGTIETNIFLRLCNRIGVFEQYVGELEPILGDEIKRLTKEIFNTKLTSEQQKEMVDQTARVIERKKCELEIFDKERTKFLGQDDYFTEQVSNIQKEERFITSKEIENLVTNFIKEEFPKSRIDKLKQDNFQIHVNVEFRNVIIDHLDKENLSGELRDNFLQLINQDSFLATFDYKIANANPHIEFITIRHPLIKSIISYYTSKDFVPFTKIICKADINGNFIFFVYLLEIKSFTKSLTFLPVVVEINGLSINKELSGQLFKLINNSEDYKGGFSLDNNKIKHCEEIALEYMVSMKILKENELKQTNESLINDRLSSLEYSHNIRIQKVDEIIERMKRNLNEKTQRIINMKLSQKQNLLHNFDKKRNELISNKKVIVSHELVGGGFLDVRKE